MKRTISWLLVFVVLVSVFSPASAVVKNTYDPVFQQLAPINLTARDNLSKVNGFDFQYLPAPDTWKNFVAGSLPAKLKGVTYAYQDNVVPVSSSVVDEIQSAAEVLGGTSDRPVTRILAEGGFLSKSLLQSVAGTAHVQAGSIFVDSSSGTAFKVVSPMSPGELTYPFSEDYSLTRPQVGEVVKDLQIPSQELDLNRANITGFADPKIVDYVLSDSEVQQLALENDFFKFKHLKNPMIAILFPAGLELKGYLGDGEEITVEVSGGIGIGDLALDAEYSAMGSYHFALSQVTEAFCDIKVGIDVHEEVRIPIYGIDIGFGIGSVTGGVFLVCTLDGEIQIEIQTRQWATTSVGVGGKTFFCIPVTANPYFGMPADKLGMTGDVQISGQINGTIKVGAMVSIEIFGWELVGVGVFVGAGLTISGSSGPPPMMDVELYGLVQVYVCLLGMRFDLVDLHITIFKRKQADMGVYRVKIDEADAYRNFVGGTVEVMDKGTMKYKPVEGVKVGIVVTPTTQGSATPTPVEYTSDSLPSCVSNSYGEFWTGGIDLKRDDKVQVKILDAGVARVSDYVLPTFPFKQLIVDEADYFNDYVAGHVVPVRVRKWGSHTGDETLDSEQLTYSGPVVVQVNRQYGIYGDYKLQQTATVDTDANGRFVADSGPEFDMGATAGGTTTIDGQPIDIHATDHMTVLLDKDGFLVTEKSMKLPSIDFVVRRVVEKGATKRYTQGLKTIDQTVYNERLYIINMRGTKKPVDANVGYQILGLSTQDRLTMHQIFYEYPSGWDSAQLTYKTASRFIPGLYPATTGLKMQAVSGDADGTALIDNRIYAEWVWQPHSNPTTITSPNHFECTTAGATFPVVATGVAPLAYSLSGAPAGVKLDKASGVLTILNTLAIGTYTFAITVKASTTQYPPGTVFTEGTYPDYREDGYPPVTQTFTLTVTAATVTPAPTPIPTPTGAAPIITSTDHASCTSAGITPSGSHSFQVTATGKKPMTFSLSSSSSSFNSVPPQVSIDPASGLITFQSDFPKNTYTFYINADNGIDPPAQQLFTLTVGASLLAPRPWNMDEPVLFAANPNYTPVNTFTLRNDDPLDLYTNDMFFLDGSGYVKWDGIVSISIDGGLIQAAFIDASPINDHHLTHLTKEEKDAVMAGIDGMIHDETRIVNAFDAKDGFGGFGKGLDDGFGIATIIDYGDIIKGLGKYKGGNYGVDLGGDFGTVLPGKVFIGLKNVAKTKLSLYQEGATIVFGSEDMTAPDARTYIDFGFTKNAPSAEGMKEALEGAESFTYAFAHSGNMPGMARFSIQTGMKPGLEVNVYRFDSETLAFTAIAEGLHVGAGGFVEYDNDTMSEYVITTATLAGVARADVYERNSRSAFFGSWGVWAAGGGGLLVLLVLGAVLVARRRRSRAKSRPASE